MAGGIDADTLALLHMDGANGATTTTDVIGNSVTITSGCSLSTGSFKFGTASLSVDGTTGHGAQIADAAQFDRGTGDFCAECFVNFTSLANDPVVIGWGPDGGGAWMRVVSSKPYFYFNSIGALCNSGSTSFTTGTWYHFAMTKQGTNLRAFINGNLESTSAVSGAATMNTTTGVMIGGRAEGSASASLNGFIDEARISRVVRYTASFTAPAGPFDGWTPGARRIRNFVEKRA